MPRLRFVVTGRVQGVAFRVHTRDAAARLGVVGYVRNRSDGAVEGEAEADDASLAEFVAVLHRGSPWGKVEAVETEAVEERGCARFEIRH